MVDDWFDKPRPRVFPEAFLKEVVRRADANLCEQLVKANHVVEQQNKVIANLTEALKATRKRAPRSVPSVSRVNFSRNKSWRRSAILGLREGIWLAPSKVLWDLGVALATTLAGVLKTVGAVIKWPILLPIVLITGFFGYLVENEESKR